MRLMTAAALALALSGPAFAQTATTEPATAPIPQNGGVVEVPTGQDVGATLGTGALPGVGIGTATTTETNTTAGPGGLQNGVGAAGVMAPDLSGAAGSADGGVPGSADGPSGGVPIETTPGVSN